MAQCFRFGGSVAHPLIGRYVIKPSVGQWNYQVYNYDFGSGNDQAFDIESGTLVGSGQSDGFDSATLVNDARGTTGGVDDFGDYTPERSSSIL